MPVSQLLPITIANFGIFFSKRGGAYQKDKGLQINLIDKK